MNFQFQCPQGHVLQGDPSQAGQTCQCPTCGAAFIIPAPLPGAAPQYQQPGYPGVPQPGVPQPGYPQPGVPQPGVPQPGYPQPGYPQPGVPQPGYGPAPAPHPAPMAPTPPAAPMAPTPPAAPVAPTPPAAAAPVAPQPPVPPTPPATAAGESPAPMAVAVPAASAPKKEKLLHIPCPNGHELECPDDMIGEEVLCPECDAQFTLRASDSVEEKRKKKLKREREEKKLGDAWFNFAVIAGVFVLIGVTSLVILAMNQKPAPTKAPPESDIPTLFPKKGQSPANQETNPGEEANPVPPDSQTPGDASATP